ncbi:hypothetical protein JGS6364_13061 [[Clostridium] sordellii]|uniref:hypothetical protein n=1 Tax=Paraclostridium sordellii TaxID=1505 RepID=UPI0003030823|nr:hypothetical protein [Paeniclostridium sordellii]TAN67341.1 hypothetical protein WS9_008690 [Paeniclostridium sordellii 8483]CEK30660.1 hypothetical protein JGS6364_13061 [[Clostridium] sordellii] [Paeniclostridium sordellii]
MNNNLKEKEYEAIKKDEEEKDREQLGQEILDREHINFEFEKETDPAKLRAELNERNLKEELQDI